MDIGVLTVPLGGESIDDAVAYLDDIGVDAVELGVGGWPARTVDREAILTTRRGAGGATRRTRPPDLPRSRPTTTPPPRRGARRGRPRAPRGDRACRPAGRGHGHLFLRPSCRRAGRLDAELDHGAVAERTRRRPRVSMGRGRDPVLDGSGETQTTTGWMSPSRCTRTCSCTSDRHARAREATNERIGANFDPSHLYWRGIDVIEAIRFFGRPRRDPPLPREGHQGVRRERAREGRTRHDELHRRERSLVAVPFDRLRPRREPPEGRRLDAPDGRVRGRAVDRTRGLADLPRGRG